MACRFLHKLLLELKIFISNSNLCKNLQAIRSSYRQKRKTFLQQKRLPPLTGSFLMIKRSLSMIFKMRIKPFNSNLESVMSKSKEWKQHFLLLMKSCKRLTMWDKTWMNIKNTFQSLSQQEASFKNTSIKWASKSLRTPNPMMLSIRLTFKR
jgi:hypothetical protein